MSETTSDNLGGKTGVVSNLNSFLYRHLDTGFKSKWDGLWSPPYKYLDYYALKINGTWLNSDALKSVEHEEKMHLTYETAGYIVEEIIKAPENIPGIRVRLDIKNKGKKAKNPDIKLEAGIDIREKSQDTDYTDYSMDKGSKRLTVGRNSEKLMISSKDKFELKNNSYSKTHYPGEKQRCFIPGDICFKKEIENQSTLEIEFTTSNGVFGKTKKIDQDLEMDGIGKLFNSSVKSMKNLTYDRDGVGVIAGHPWFQSYWARDTFWTLLGMIDAGYFQLSRDILTNFAENGLPGKINIRQKNEKLERSDTEPLFIIAANKLERHFQTNKAIEKAKQKAIKKLDTDKRGVINHNPEGTWMDTTERGKAIDIQSLWLKAAELENLGQKEKLQEGLKEFIQGEYPKDNLESEDLRTINPVVPLMFNQIQGGGRYLKKINSEFLNEYGVSTMSEKDSKYSSKGYHNGSSWGLTAAWTAITNFKQGNTQKARKILENQKQFLKRNQLNALPETVNSKTGKSLGCSEQAWTAGLVTHAIDTHLLGIEVKTPEKAVINPSKNINCIRKGKKIGTEKIDVKIKDGNAEILNNPDIEIETR